MCPANGDVGGEHAVPHPSCPIVSARPLLKLQMVPPSVLEEFLGLMMPNAGSLYAFSVHLCAFQCIYVKQLQLEQQLCSLLF